MQVALGGLGQVADAPLPPTLPGYSAELRSHALAYDPAQAEALLQEAGFQRDAAGKWNRDGAALTVVLLTSTRAPNETIATLLQSQLAAIGVDVEIQMLDSKAVMAATTEGAFDLLLWRYDWNDPDALNIYLGSDRIGSTNRVGYSNPQVDALLVQGAQEMDAAARAGLYVEAQKLILADAPWQPLYYPVDIIATGKRLQVRSRLYGRLLLNDAPSWTDKMVSPVMLRISARLGGSVLVLMCVSFITFAACDRSRRCRGHAGRRLTCEQAAGAGAERA